MPRTEEVNTLLNEATSGMMAALTIYRRRAATVPLYVQCALKLAAVSTELGQNVFASQLLCAAYGDGVANSHVEETSMGDDLLSVEDVILLATSVALLYKDMKMSRKHAFFLREAVLLCHHHTHAYRKAHALLQLTAPAYKIRLPLSGTQTPAPFSFSFLFLWCNSADPLVDTVPVIADKDKTRRMRFVHSLIFCMCVCLCVC